MRATIEPQPKSVVKLTVELTPEEMQRHYAAVIQSLAQQADVKGFRKGKAPRPVLEQRYGADYIAHQVLERAITLSYYDAIKEHNLESVAQPQTELPDDHHNTEKTGLTYTAMVPVMPQIELGDYRSVKVKSKKSDYAPKLVDEALDELRRGRAAYEPVERGAQDGDRVEIDFAGTLNGEEVPGAKSENHPLVIGEDTFIPGFADELKKLKRGDQKKFKIRFPKDYHEKSLADQKVEFAVTMKEVQERKMPDLNDEFAKELGADSMTQLKERLEANLKAEREQLARRQTEQDVIDGIAKKASFELPDALIEAEAERLVDELRQGVEAQGMPFDKYLEHLGKDVPLLAAERRAEAEQRVRTSLLLSKIAEEEKVAPDKKQVDREVEAALASASDAQRAQIDQDDYRRYVTRVLTNQAVLDKIVARATE